MHSFRVLSEVVPNAVTTYCSRLFPGSASEKVTKKCGLLSHFEVGDPILAYKGFLINDTVPKNLNTALCRIHIKEKMFN